MWFQPVKNKTAAKLQELPLNLWAKLGFTSNIQLQLSSPFFGCPVAGTLVSFCPCLRFLSHTAAFAKFAKFANSFDLKFSFHHVATQNRPFNSFERDTSWLPANSANEIFWHAIVKDSWIESVFSAFFETVIKISTKVHVGMEFGNHTIEAVPLLQTIISEVCVAVSKPLNSTTAMGHTRWPHPDPVSMDPLRKG